MDEWGIADYGLDATDAASLAKETADFETIIANPAAANSRRRQLQTPLLFLKFASPPRIRLL